MITDFIHFASKELEKDIGDIKPDQVKPFWSEGKWSMHELIFYLLDITGPAKVWLSTFSISEIAVRAFSLAIENGYITELYCLFDYTIKRHKLNLLYFAKNIINDIKLSANHSKLFLIENNHWNISVVGSANMTPNPRKEAGAIFTDINTFVSFKRHFLKALESGVPINFKTNENI